MKIQLFFLLLQFNLRRLSNCSKFQLFKVFFSKDFNELSTLWNYIAFYPLYFALIDYNREMIRISKLMNDRGGEQFLLSGLLKYYAHPLRSHNRTGPEEE